MKEIPSPEIKLTPTLSGNVPGTPLFDFFNDRLPPDLPQEVYDYGLSCQGYARLILEQLGGPTQARVFLLYGKGEGKARQNGHVYVIGNTQLPEEVAYNSDMPEWTFTVDEVRKRGEDITDITLNEPWEKL